jgi:tetratricopeptide (TPR) repeat protein
MKKNTALFTFLSVFLALCGAENTKTFASGHYLVVCPEQYQGVEALADSFNAEWNYFNEFFCFGSSPDVPVCRVIIPADKAEFDKYISDRIGETRNQPVFLKYSDASLSELVLVPGTAVSSSAFPGQALNRQLFLQYLYSFVSEPPLWIRDGFQAYFENISWDSAGGKISNAEVSPWLETAKNLAQSENARIPVDGLLSALTGSYDSSRFYPQSWAFVSFMLGTEKQTYQRFFHEACLLVGGSGTFNGGSQKENTELLRNRFMQFHSADSADADFTQWLSGQYTWNELFQSGVTAYGQGRYAEARATLMNAAKIRANDPFLLYYLGLISYAEKKYTESETWYRKALAQGGDVATINWALGLESFADKRYQESRVYLETAKSANPAKYGEKADKLINSMPKQGL